MWYQITQFSISRGLEDTISGSTQSLNATSKILTKSFFNWRNGEIEQHQTVTWKDSVSPSEFPLWALQQECPSIPLNPESGDPALSPVRLPNLTLQTWKEGGGVQLTADYETWLYMKYFVTAISRRMRVSSKR